MVLTLRLIVVYGFLLWKAVTDWSRIIEEESIYCAVGTESLYMYKTKRYRL
jgi:hypothetical protein